MNKWIWIVLFWLGLNLWCATIAAKTNSAPTPLLLTVTINQKSIPAVIQAYQTAKSTIWLSEADLSNMGLLLTDKNLFKMTFNNQEYVELNSIQALTYRLDMATLTLTISAKPDLFKTQVINAENNAANQNERIRPKTPGLFLGYDATSQVTQTQGLPTTTSLLTDIGGFNSLGTGDSQFLFQVPSTNTANTIVRLNTQWTQDQPEHIATLRLGDSITSSSSWSGAARFGGIQYATNFATRPGLITFPLPNIKGEATLPSTVNLLVNNVVGTSDTVNSGPFIVQNIPAVTGAGTVSVVTQDILGRQQVTNIPYYTSPDLLKPGMTNFSYEAGIMRRNFSIKSNEYAHYLATGTYGRGITDHLTATGHLELLGYQQTAGFTTDYLWGNHGIISFSLAGSHSNSLHEGGLASLGYSRQATPFSYGAQTTWASSGFTQVGLQTDQLSSLETTLVYASYDMKKAGQLSLSYTNTRARQNASNTDEDSSDDDSNTNYSFVAPTSEFVTLNYSKNIWKSASISGGIIQNIHGNQGDQIYITFSMGLGNDYSMNLQGTSQPAGQQLSGDFAKAVPVGNGYGYNFYTAQGSTHQYLASIAAQNNYAAYSGAVARYMGENSAQANVTGSILHFAGETHFSRDFLDSGTSFGLVQVPGFANVKVYSQNQYIGKTNSKGDLVVTNLLPYQPNQITIDPDDLPLDTYFSKSTQTVIPYYHSGTLVRFDARILNTAVIYLVLNHHEAVPEGAQVKLNNSDQAFMVGTQGEVFISTLGKGVMNGTASFEDRTCHFSFNMPQTPQPIPNLGVVTCS